MNWISVEDELPNKGEVVLTYRPKAKETGDLEYVVAKYIEEGYQKSPQGVKHGFHMWCHPTHWAKITKP